MTSHPLYYRISYRKDDRTVSHLARLIRDDSGVVSFYKVLVDGSDWEKNRITKTDEAKAAAGTLIVTNRMFILRRSEVTMVPLRLNLKYGELEEVPAGQSQEPVYD